MAYGPCPKCHNKAQFDKLFDTLPQHKAFEQASYLVMEGGHGNFGALQCDKVAEHRYDSPDAVVADYKAGGFLSYY